jgi:hypothetical protein
LLQDGDVGVGVFPERGRDFGLSGGWAEIGAAIVLFPK